MQLLTAASPRKAAALPSGDIMSALETLNHAAQAKGNASPQAVFQQLTEDGAAADVDLLLSEMSSAENYLKKLREALEERRAVKTVERQLREGQAEFEEMIEQKLFLEPADFAQAMHWTKQALSKALGANRVFYLEHRGRRYYPAFFADAQYERRQLEGVCQALGELPGASKWQFLSTPKGSLDGQTPLAALRSGKYSRVKVAAAGFAER